MMTRMEARETYTRRLAAIAFADVAGWSRLIEQDDVATLTAWKAVRSGLIEPKIQQHNGRLLEVAGDAVLVEFPSAVAAVAWAVDVQRGLIAPDAAAGIRLTMRIGVNVEDVIVDGEKLVGNGVNVASRIQQLAEPGEIVVTQAVRDHVRNKMAVSFGDLGERRLKNVSRTLRLYRVELDPGKDASFAPRESEPAASTWLTIEPATGSPAQLLEQLLDQHLSPSRPLRAHENGQGALVFEFGSAREAAAYAFAVQRIGGGKTHADRPTLRMGIEIGEASGERRAAARISALADPGDVLVSAAARDQLIDGLDVSIEDLGEQTVAATGHTVRAFRALPPALPVQRRPERSQVASNRPSIAVLPFRNLSGDPANEYLGDLIAEDVIGDLSRLIDLTVISRLSTAAFRSRPYQPSGVAEALDVRYVLSGTLHTSAARLRIAADLSDAVTGQVIWAERFEGSVAGIFDLQDQVSHAISRRVVPYVRQLELQRARSAHADTLTAYERTLRAIDHFHRSSRRDHDEARALLESAIEANPSYVTPYAWLAHWYVRRVGQGWSDDPSRDTIEANRYSEGALQRDPTDPQALTVSGLVAGYLNKDLESAIDLHNRALTINPSACSAWLWSTSAYAWLGEGGEAVRRSNRAIELSPLDPQMYMFTSIAGTAHAVAGIYDKAIEFCKRSLRLNRMFASTHRIMTLSLSLAGRESEAREAANELLKLEPGLTASGFLRRYPGSDSAHAKVFAEGLAAAGIPQ